MEDWAGERDRPTQERLPKSPSTGHLLFRNASGSANLNRRRNARAKEESKMKKGRQNHEKERNKKLHLSGKVPFPEDLDFSIIGKVNETEQEDEDLGDSFVAPLHSTALYSEVEEICRSSETTIPSVDSPPPGKKARKRVEVTENHPEEEEDSIIGRRKKTRRKSSLRINDTTSESVSDRVASVVKSMKKQKVKVSPTVHAASLPEKPVDSASSDELIPVAEKASLNTKEKATPPRTRQNPRGKEKSHSGPLNPDKKKRSTRDLRKPDVVLSAFEEILIEYKQRVTSRVCQRAMDRFYLEFKEYLIKVLTEVQRLKNLKRRNARVTRDATRKRKCLFEAQEQQIRMEPQLKQLQRKYEELEHRRSSLREATWFLSGLQHLHDDYAALPQGPPTEREQYDASSLPALLLEARGISGATQHLGNINYRLQQLIDDK